MKYLKCLKPVKWVKTRARLSAAALGLLAISFFVLSGPDYNRPRTNAEMARTSVQVVRADAKAGGTGVILSSTPTETTVLTNRHVCKVIEHGGLVISESGTYLITGLKRSKVHDLCLVTVAADLGLSTEVSSRAPDPHSGAAISGHPGLLPNIVTRGHFSQHKIIEVMTGIRKCTDEEIQGDLGIFCIMMGGLPEIHRYDSVVVSATIKPGSSGSAVFNDEGQIAGLAFAGSGGNSPEYAYAVPLESIANFVLREQRFLEMEVPDNAVDLGTVRNERKQIEEVCDQAQTQRAKDFCELVQKAIERDIVWKD